MSILKRPSTIIDNGKKEQLVARFLKWDIWVHKTDFKNCIGGTKF